MSYSLQKQSKFLYFMAVWSGICFAIGCFQPVEAVQPIELMRQKHNARLEASKKKLDTYFKDKFEGNFDRNSPAFVKQKQEEFTFLDKNRNNQLTTSEMKAPARKLFKTYDLNSDKTVYQGEYIHARNTKRDMYYETYYRWQIGYYKFDFSYDRKVGLKEFLEPIDEKFAKLDLNKDRQLTFEEYRQW